MLAVLVAFVLQAAIVQAQSVAAAAAKYVPGAKWQAKSVVTADFSCQGRSEQAILGTSSEEILVAVFLRGTTQPPEVLRYSAKARDATTTELTVEDQDYDPAEEDLELPGFRRSRTCKGLNLSDGKIDSAHIYWNHDARRFDDWVR